MGVRGLALATTVSGTGGMLVLFYLLRRRMRRLGMKRIVPDMAKIFLASGLTALVAWGVGSLMPVAENRMFAILRMLAMGGAGLGVYLLIALALGVTPLKEFIGRKGNAMMDEERLITTGFREEDEQADVSLRPRTLTEYFGQEN